MQTLVRARPGGRDVATPEFVGRVTDLIRPNPSGPVPRPQAFLVEQSPNWTLPTHFHQEHQFQVFVAGSGTIGRSAVHRLAVHYASPHTGYGPLISGDAGISYLTLRAVGDTGAWYLPRERDHLLVRIRKQQAHAAPSSAIDGGQLRMLAEPAGETLIEPDAAGLGAWLVRLGAGARAPVPAPGEAAGGGGRFYVVAQGGLVVGGEELHALATVFVSTEEPFELLAGRDGAEVLVLQFPAAAEASFAESRPARS